MSAPKLGNQATVISFSLSLSQWPGSRSLGTLTREVLAIHYMLQINENKFLMDGHALALALLNS